MLQILIFSTLAWAASGSLGKSLGSSASYQLYSRGVEAASKKKYDEAMEKFELAIKQNPQYIASYIEWARAAVMRGRRRDGLEKLTLAMNFARSGEERGRVQRERENLSEIFFTNETFQRYQDGLNYLKLDRPSDAVEKLEQALTGEPDNVMVLRAYAAALSADEKQKESISALERAHLLNDAQADVRIDLADATLGQNPERAQQLLKPIINGGPIPERAALTHAQALSALKKNREAIEFLRQQFERTPSSLFLPFWLGKMYSAETGGGWNARKFLMTFLKRSEPLASQGEGSAEGRRLRAARVEAESILTRVNRALE